MGQTEARTRKYLDPLVAPDRVPAAIHGKDKMYIDLETEGLLTYSHGKLRRARSQKFGPRVSEIAVTFDGVIDARASGYTNIIDLDLLERHGLTAEAGWTPAKLRDPKVALPRSFYEELVGNSGPAKWDLSVAVEEGAKGRESSTLNRVAREHAASALEGTRLRTLEDFASAVMEKVDALPKDRKMTLSGWNVASFDLPVMLKQLSSSGLGKRLAKAVSSGRIQVTDAARNYHRLAFEHMLENSRYTPVISDMKLIKEAVNRTKSVSLDASQFVKKNLGLRRFMNDVSRHTRGRAAFHKRAQMWASKYRGTADEKAAKQAAQQVAEILGNIGKGQGDIFDSVMEVTRQAQASRGDRIFVSGDRSFSMFDIVGDMYRGRRSAHRATHVLGDPTRLASEALVGQVHGFQFVGGGRLTDVADSLTKAMKMTEGYQDSRHIAFLENYLRNAHKASEDVQATQVVDEVLSSASGALKKSFKDVHFSPEVVRRRTADTVYRHAIDHAVGQGLVQTALTDAAIKSPPIAVKTVNEAGKVAALGVEEKVKAMISGGLAGIGTWWKGLSGAQRFGVGAAAAVGLWLANKNGREERKEIEGIRKPSSEYLTIPGINPSDMPGANVSWFSSGSHRYHLTASGLGNSDRNLTGKREKAAEEGDRVHKEIQHAMMRKGLLRSYEASVDGFGMSSRVDAILRNGLPFEIKTTNADVFRDMVRPRAKDIGQINYDILASGSKYGYLAYASREDSTKVKLYRITPDVRMLQQQTSALAEERRTKYRTPMMEFAAAYFSQDTTIGRGLGNLQSMASDLMSTVGIEQSDPFSDMPIPEYDAGDFAEEAQYGEDLEELQGHAGLVQELSNTAKMSKLRDYGAQLSRVKMFRETRMSNISPARHSHASRYCGGI